MSGRLNPVTMVNLKLLHAFTLVAKHSSFRAAAEQTFRSQSAISTQIKQLERQLGVPLFSRTTRKVCLTTEGEVLLSGAEKAIEEVNLALRRIQHANDVHPNYVSFGCSRVIATTCLAEVLSIFEREYPQVLISVREMRSLDLLEAVRCGELDFAACVMTPHPEFEFEAIYTEDFYAYVPDNLVRAHGTACSLKQKSISLAELTTMPILLGDSHSTNRRLMEHAIHQSNLVVRPKYEVMQAQTAISIATAGLAVAILQKSALPAKRKPGMHILHIVEPTISWQFGIARLPNHELSPTARRLTELISDYYASPLARPSRLRVAAAARSRSSQRLSA